MRVFVTGGSGFLGRSLVEALSARGDQVVALTRSASRSSQGLPGAELVEGDPTAVGDWQARVTGCDAVVNLAGESVGARRWNAQVRQILHDSRIDTTRYLVEAIGAAPIGARPAVLVSASGTDYYPFDVDLEIEGDDDDGVDERAPAGSTFLARLCRDWEEEALAAERHGARVVVMRTGVVVGGRGGSIDRWARAFRWFVGGKLGRGRQWMSWVHIEDVVAAYLFALDSPALRGAVNLVAPERIRNRDFARRLGRTLGRPSWFPTPAPILRLALGGFAEHLLNGRPVVPRALISAGYQFKHPVFGAD